MGKVGGSSTDRSTGTSRLINFISRCHLVDADVSTVVSSTSAELCGVANLQNDGVRFRMRVNV